MHAYVKKNDLILEKRKILYYISNFRFELYNSLCLSVMVNGVKSNCVGLRRSLIDYIHKNPSLHVMCELEKTFV